jgi:hypothetical protein
MSGRPLITQVSRAFRLLIIKTTGKIGMAMRFVIRGHNTMKSVDYDRLIPDVYLVGTNVYSTSK